MVRTNRRIAILASAASLLAVVFSGVAQASDHHDSGYSDDDGYSADSGSSADDETSGDNNDDGNARGGVGGKAGENSSDCGLALKRGAGQHCHTVPAQRGEDGPDAETY